MRIRKVEDKPMEFHTKKGTKLRIKKSRKKIRENTSVRRKQKLSLSGVKESIKESGSSIHVKRQGLYIMGRIGASKAADQIEGGEEIKESAGLTAFALSSVYNGADHAKQIYLKKKQTEKAEQNKSASGKRDTAKVSGDNTQYSDKELSSGKSRYDRRKRKRHDSSASYSDIEKRKSTIKAKSHSQVKTKNTGGGSEKAVKNHGFIKARMLEVFLANKRRDDENQQTVALSMKESVKAAALMIAKKIAVSVLPAFLGIFSVIALVGIIVVAVLGVIYNSPLSVFFPLPDTGYENPRTVLSSYYMEFNKKVMAIEENGDEITYQNTENGAPVSNFNDTLMVYMILYGDGKTGFVMDEDGKRNLKKVFDEMNYIDSASSAVEKEVGDSLGKVWVTAYCPCAICCGPYANGITASGKTARAKHTIAVDAYNPIVPMGTKVVIEGVTYTVEDTGDLNHYGNDFDIFYAHHEDCGQWGRQHVEAYLAEGNTNKVMVTTSGTTVHNLTFKDYINKGTLTEEQKAMLTDLMDSDLWDTYYSCAAGAAVAELAMTKIGCHYSQDRRYEEGYYDCSSLVQRLYKEVGIDLPATASPQGKYCYENAMLVNKKDLKPGDLIFYSYEENGKFRNISHVAIYVGDGMMVHAANPRRGVVYDPLRDSNVVFYARPYK